MLSSPAAVVLNHLRTGQVSPFPSADQGNAAADDNSDLYASEHLSDSTIIITEEDLGLLSSHYCAAQATQTLR
jgi:hypothetical protein